MNPRRVKRLMWGAVWLSFTASVIVGVVAHSVLIGGLVLVGLGCVYLGGGPVLYLFARSRPKGGESGDG